ncbi:MAG: lipid IV(A) 3-deoxy-D-manno-octulosonic acid transferase [Arenicellales bacterium]
MLIIYRLILYISLPVLIVRFLLRGLSNRSYFERITERFGFSETNPAPGGVWIHAVSVGEVNAAVPLVNRIMKTWPDKSITVTTMTTTGSDRVQKVFGSSVSHCYLPYDFPGAVRRFVQRISPQLGLVMETEIWPNLIFYCHQQGIPLIYTNVRLSERSWRGYNRFRFLFSQILKLVSKFAVQSESDARRLIQLGAPEHKLSITGSLKFDINLPPSVSEAGESIRRQIGWNRPVLIAASTHEGEELLVIEVYHRIRSNLPELLLIIVPRHPERFTAVAKMCVKDGLNTIQRTEMSAQLSSDIEVLVVDTMGELPMFIAAGDVTFMGGSLVPVGGHNLLEAAALGQPVVFGPHMFNFAEISEMFLQQGAGVQVFGIDELAEVCERLLLDGVIRDQYGTQGEKLVQQNRGALEQVMEFIRAELEA